MGSIAKIAFTAKMFESELLNNILPFWRDHLPDRENGGFYGAISSSNQIQNDVERSAVLCSRILWTFSKAANKYSDPSYLEIADWAWQSLTGSFWDEQFGGIYWSIDKRGNPVMDRKHTYAQSFAIYGLTAYYEATRNQSSLELAKRLFQLIDHNTYDLDNCGNVECLSREWKNLEDMRLSDKDLNSHKSMNTLLHLVEAYAALARLWRDDKLLNRLTGLMDVFMEHVIDIKNGHQRLFFNDQWISLSNHISYGHDIETSWLLQEAAQVLGDPPRIDKVKETDIRLAQTVYEQALEEDGAILYEASPDGFMETTKQWWAHAEAVVGFYNAFQLTGKDHFNQSAAMVWDYIQTHFIDRSGGDWFKLLDRYGQPILAHEKAGPWDCPYHHARMCMEMIERLNQ